LRVLGVELPEAIEPVDLEELLRCEEGANEASIVLGVD
jgi:hypothetical protein